MKYKVELEFELTDREFEFLKKLYKKGYAEFRDVRFETSDDWLNHPEHHPPVAKGEE